MTRERPVPPAPIRLLAGAAAGAVALALLGGLEIVLRLRADPPLLVPYRDLSFLATGGAIAGAVVGVLRGVHPLRFLSPFGITLGTGIALTLWLDSVAGGVVGSAALGAAVRGAGAILLGAALGQLLGGALGRLGAAHLAPNPARDAFLVAILVGIGLAPLRSDRTASEGPNVLLLTIDTLRSDRLGYAGHPGGISPALDRLARRSLAFERATTPLPRTLPAFVSIMTGLVPSGHGVRDNFHYALGSAPITLAERLRDAGWATAAVNSNPVLSHDSGVYRGFESASDRGDDWARLRTIRGLQRLVTLVRMRQGDRAQIITDLAISWLDLRPHGRPFFLWVHWLAPHMPYEPTFPYDRTFDPDYTGALGGRLDYGEISKGDMTYRNPLSPRDVEHAKHLYDGEVATADRALARLLRRLEETGDLSRTIVLFTSDHGESLDEHGYFFNHGDYVYGPGTNVPFLLRVPDARSGLSRDIPSLVDVFPHLARSAGVPTPPDLDGDVSRPESVPRFGESGFCRFPDLNPDLGYLLPVELAQNPDLIEDWRGEWEAQANRAKQRYVEQAGYKLVLTPRPDGDRTELFDLLRDPGETRDVAAAHPETEQILEATVRGWIARGDSLGATAEVREIDEDLREKMDALGYRGK
ncbi:MAG: sulfatase [bacterium]